MDLVGAGFLCRYNCNSEPVFKWNNLDSNRLSPM